MLVHTNPNRMLVHTNPKWLCFQGYIVQLFRDLIDRQAWSDEGSSSQRMLRSYLLLFACVRGHPPCVHKATELFQKWKESDGNMRSDVYRYIYRFNSLFLHWSLRGGSPTPCFLCPHLNPAVSPMTSAWLCLPSEPALKRGGTSSWRNTNSACTRHSRVASSLPSL